MFFRDKHCPTCGGLQVFRKLDAKERAAVADERPYGHDLWRCTAEGCRWYQPWGRQSNGGLLPEDLRMPAAATE